MTSEKNSLELGVFLGAGSYGNVYSGRWAARRAAIKKFNMSRDEVSQQAAIRHEIDLLEKLRCRHIIQFYGATYHEEKLVLIMDYAEGGSLERAIRSRQLDWPTRTRISQEIAGGLAYIHHENILHRDLKSANVLLTKHMEVKLADFGLALVKSTSSSKSADNSIKGTVRWMAPELFARKPLYSTKSDVYALGMVMWEMAANSTKPFSEHIDNGAVIHLITRGEREELPDDTPQDYRDLVHRCWDQDPTNRPEAVEMVGADDDPIVTSNGEGTTLELSLTALGSSISSPSSAGTQTIDNPAIPLPKDLDSLLRLANDGNVEAQMALAKMYSRGDGVRQNHSTAVHWYWQAADQGNTEAQYQLGYHLRYGRGISQNFELAYEWLNKAVEKEHPGAQCTLGTMYLGGYGVEKNHANAVILFLKAAQQNHSAACFLLGRMYHEGDGIATNYSDAATWYRKAVEQDNEHAQASLGELYKDGLGVTKDYDTALELFHKAAEQGSGRAHYHIGWMYEHGMGVVKDMEQAKSWYNKAAKLLYPDAMDRLEEFEKAERPKSLLRRIFG
ncbi:hypothetical protein BGW42_006886 [Actinomortierella wolfii]|nr:hypothetical protein BGW42_006886 [Actinomortierella wolfii]